ncbi:PAS domain-containing hybrid sensor histidine kinase/response regulator [Flavisphingomonas formosensis]|uniref:PAS domain-containing hybrid sensor histidine kinase/response regulator n=1 Tax=Flavisphingomonas formosensis TaxID=861534 RepID=UPI0018DFC9AA|nr:PAS domain-containing hybrid sensor histidine kinase/response regulator [Sphingomonas formosensis]
MRERREAEDPWIRLIAASERMASSRSIDAVVEILRETARDVVGADGICVVLRQDDHCYYAGEDAISPLWAGSRFPAESCISGWSMINRKTAVIRDVLSDPRIPRHLYEPTFVRSLVMAPIGLPNPTAAIGAYWQDLRNHDRETIARLEALARAAALAIENARLIESLQDSERQRRIALNAGRMGVWRIEVTTGVLEASDLCKTAFGRDPAEPFTYGDMQSATHPDDRDRLSRAMHETLTSGADYDIEYRILTPGGEERWIEFRGQPSFSAEGEPMSVSGVSIDVSDRRRLEAQLRDFATTLEERVVDRTRQLVRTQDALRQSQRLEAMGQLTGGVAHDFNNLLTPILGSLDLLKRRGIGDAREQRLIDGALQSADRAKTLVQRLLAFARRQPLKASAVDLAALILDLTPLIGTTVGAQVELVLDLQEDLPLAWIDATQIETALLNLAMNARDAMEESGTLRIEARHVMVGEGHAAGLIPGSYVRLAVVDTGKGMDEETRRRSIEPFFSTKGIGQGTGLGLSMVHGVVAQLGGALSVASEPGVGTVIELWLPTTSEPILVTTVDDNAIPERWGMALVVDDEDLVRVATADMLAELGFDVVEAASGMEALAMLDRYPDIDLLVTDHLMPEMTGTELAAVASVRRPDLRVLVVSGYSDAIGISPGLARLEKPFRQTDLAQSLAAIMKRPRFP